MAIFLDIFLSWLSELKFTPFLDIPMSLELMSYRQKESPKY